MKIELFYDKECPFCNSYAKYLKLKENHTLILFNARDSKKYLDFFRAKGFDINDGFIIRVDEKSIYQGVDAIVLLNDLAQKKIYFPDNLFFRDIIYPIIKLFRMFILFISFKKIKL